MARLNERRQRSRSRYNARMSKVSRPPVIDGDYRVIFAPSPGRARSRRVGPVSSPVRPFLELFLYAAILALCQSIMRSLPPPPR